MSERDGEILIVGGGPAACTAARLLASWGHAVRLVARPPAQEEEGAGLAESLTPSCGKFFDLLGMRDRIDAAGFVETSGNTVWWGSETPRIEAFANGARGWQVVAPRLESVMRRAAVDVGVTIEDRVLTVDEARAWPARFRLDGTGRAGLLGPGRANRVPEPAHRTVALSAVWRATAGWEVPDASHTLLESYADGWAWSVPLDSARRAVAVMVDPRTSSLARGAGAAATYLAEIDKTRQFRQMLRAAVREGGPTGWDASMYRAAECTGDDWLLIGDAASFVDPLSSAGVKKALASGWLAAIVTHTSLTNPAMGPVARRFFADRERDMYEGYLELTRHFLREGAPGSQPFWADRAETREWEERQTLDAAERAAVRQVHEELRAAPELRVTVSPAVAFEPRPAIAGREIVMESRLVTPAEPAGVRYLYDVDVVALTRLAPHFRQVPDLYAAAVEQAGPMDLAAFVTALATAVARGWLTLAVPAVRPRPTHQDV